MGYRLHTIVRFSCTFVSRATGHATWPILTFKLYPTFNTSRDTPLFSDNRTILHNRQIILRHLKENRHCFPKFHLPSPTPANRGQAALLALMSCWMLPSKFL